MCMMLLTEHLPSEKLPSKPASPFPFARLGGFDPDNSTSLFLYQLNDTAFAEGQCDVTVGDWQSKNVTFSIA